MEGYVGGYVRDLDMADAGFSGMQLNTAGSSGIQWYTAGYYKNTKEHGSHTGDTVFLLFNDAASHFKDESNPCAHARLKQ